MLAKLIALLILLSSCKSATSVEIVHQEKELDQALGAADVQRLRVLWADGLLFTFPNGTMLGKDERLRAIAASPAPAGLKSTIDDIRVEMYGHTAVTSVLSTWSPVGRQYRATHVWVKKHGHWQLVAAHVSVLK
jgi:hypothetical protein